MSKNISININKKLSTNFSNRLIPAIFFIFIALISSQSFATSGESLYQTCIACHGKNGEGNEALKAPSIAGQYKWYLQRQLQNFKNDHRDENNQDTIAQPMVAIAKTLTSDEDINLVSSYIAAMPAPSFDNNKSTEGNLKNGSRYYQGKCGACHGGQAQGNTSFNAPKLAGLSTSYLLRQMQNFTNGLRGTHQQDKFGRQMAMMAKTTSGSELNDILFYISQQQVAASK